MRMILCPHISFRRAGASRSGACTALQHNIVESRWLESNRRLAWLLISILPSALPCKWHCALITPFAGLGPADSGPAHLFNTTLSSPSDAGIGEKPRAWDQPDCNLGFITPTATLQRQSESDGESYEKPPLRLEKYLMNNEISWELPDWSRCSVDARQWMSTAYMMMDLVTKASNHSRA
jgi:hypothetical protein